MTSCVHHLAENPRRAFHFGEGVMPHPANHSTRLGHCSRMSRREVEVAVGRVFRNHQVTKTRGIPIAFIIKHRGQFQQSKSPSCARQQAHWQERTKPQIRSVISKRHNFQIPVPIIWFEMKAWFRLKGPLDIRSDALEQRWSKTARARLPCVGRCCHVAALWPSEHPNEPGTMRPALPVRDETASK